MIRCLVFDFDGVLVDSNAIKRHAYYAVFNAISGAHAVVDAVRREMPTGSRFDVIAAVVARMRQNGWTPDFSDPAGYFAGRYTELCDEAVASCPEVPGATPALSDLSAHYRLYVNSATPEESLVHILIKRGMTKWFVRALGKPSSKVENLRMVMRREGTEGNQVVVIGDGRQDLESAIVMGTHFVGVRNAFNDFDTTGLVMVENLRGLPGTVADIASGRLDARVHDRVTDHT